jgi:hypothetical protein
LERERQRLTLCANHKPSFATRAESARNEGNGVFDPFFEAPVSGQVRRTRFAALAFTIARKRSRMIEKRPGGKTPKATLASSAFGRRRRSGPG